jgi:xylan 1,4-beta-xylosidase
MKLKLLSITLILFLLCSFAPPEPVNIKVDATKNLSKLDPFWASQIIHPTEFLLTGWGNNFIKLLKESGAARQYVRIYNQPEAAIRISADGKISYDWSNFDRMADIILSTGNNLKVVFFAMPFELAVHPEAVRKRPYGALVCSSPPKDYKQWEELCADFTRHVVNKYGINEVKQWTFRCWNEPDGSSFWFKGDLKEYCRLYDYFANGVKSVNKDIKIGGPALTSTGTYRKPENFKFVLDHFVNGINYATGEKGSPIDYIAIHTYGGSSGGGAPGSEFPEVKYILDQQKMYADIRDQYPTLKNLPIHAEEWGVTSGGTTGIDKKPSADVRNSQYGAAFFSTLVANIIKQKQENDRKIESLTFCSSGYEIIPTHDFIGYRTFDTKSGFHKPVLNAYKVLYRLALNLIPVSINTQNDHITAFATGDSRKITIVVTNFQNDRIFNDGQSYPVSLNITQPWKPGTKVTLNHWRIDNDHSNSYTVFKKIGSPVLPNPLEIDQIKERMDLELLIPSKQTTAKELSEIKFELPCNAVSLIEIIKN